MVSMNHIVIFRTSGSYMDYNTYNCQELGLSKALVKKGYQVSLIMAGPECKQLKYTIGNKQVDIYYLTYRAINQSLCIFDGWKDLLERLNPDVVQIHEFGMYMSYKVSSWTRKHGVRCVLIQGNYNTTQKPGLKQLERMFNLTFGKKVMSNVRSIGCKTKAAAEYVARYSDKPTMLAPVGLDESKFMRCYLESDFSECHGLVGKKILLYIGRMEQRRNPMFLLDVMQILPDDYALVMVGDGPLLDKVNERVKSENMLNVLVLGKIHQEKLPVIYAASDVFLLASNYEIFGMVILESMYFGTPVISTSTAGGKTIIENGVDGVVIDNLIASNWTRCIKDICGNKDRLSNMSIAAKRKIHEHLVWDKAADNFVKLYECDD